MLDDTRSHAVILRFRIAAGFVHGESLLHQELVLEVSSSLENVEDIPSLSMR